MRGLLTARRVSMSERAKVEPWDEIRIRRTDEGWDYCLAKRDGGIVSNVSARAATFDEAAAKAKEAFDLN
jgi:hypothetical protein